MYERVWLTYRVDTDALPRTSPAIAPGARPQLVQAGYQAHQNGLLPRDGLAIVTVRYPHPDGSRETALVEVVVWGKSVHPTAPADRSWRIASGRGDGVPGGYSWHEARRLTIPRRQLDELVALLGQAGYFTGADLPVAGVKVQATIDGQSWDKAWMPVPALDSLIAQARDQGRVASRSHGVDAPPALAAPPPDEAYEQMTVRAPVAGAVGYVPQQQQYFGRNIPPPPPPPVAGATSSPGFFPGVNIGVGRGGSPLVSMPLWR